MVSEILNRFTKGLKYLALPLIYRNQSGRLTRTLLKDRLLLHELARLSELRRWFELTGFRTLIDVGANDGAFSYAVRTMLPDCQIYAFEPLPDVFAHLENNLKPLGNFQAFCSAIGEKQGEAEFFRSIQSASSSILPMGNLHKSTFPWTAELNKVTVPLACLDDFLPQMTIKNPCLLKIDVQGYEDRVVMGAGKVLAIADYLLTEVSYRPLYEDQALFQEVYDQLSLHSYEFKGIFDNLLSPVDSSIIQSDALFMRKK